MFVRQPVFHVFLLALAFVLALPGVTSVFAADYTWSGGEGNWSGWTAWVDGSGNNANINSGPLTLDTPVTAQNVILNNNSTLNINANLTGRFLNLTASATPTANIQGGTIALTFLHVTNGSSLETCPTLTITGGSTTINSTAANRGDALVFGYGGGAYGKGSMSNGSLTLLNTSQFILGFNANAYGKFDFSGGTISVNNTLSIGPTGIGTFTMSQADSAVPTSLTATTISLGSGANSNGTFNYSGGTITTDHFTVGGSGTGKLNVTGGSLSITEAMNLKVGTKGTVEVSGGELLFPAGLTVGSDTFEGTVKVSGGTLTPASLVVGSTKAGSVTISDGTLSVKTADTYFGTGANATLTMTGGTLDATGKTISFSPESGGTAGVQTTLNLSGSSEIKAAKLFLSDKLGANTTMTMTGGKITCATQFMVGRHGNATATQSGGTISGGNLFVVGSFENTTSTLTLSGTAADSATGWYVGNFGDATLKLENITSDASVKNVSGTNFIVGVEAGSNGKVEIGSGVMEVANLYLGYGQASYGTGVAKGSLKLTGGTLKATNKISLGERYTVNGSTEYKSDGSMTVSSGTLTTPLLYAGTAEKSTGTVAVSGGQVNATTFHVGENGNGTLNMTNGTLATTTFSAGYGENGTGAVTVSGGQISATTFIVGENGNGTLNMTGGSINATGEFILGRYRTATSEALIDGGSVKVGSNLIIASDKPTTVASLTLTSGTIDSTGQRIFVANAGNGTLTLDGTGTLKASELTLSHYSGAAGTLNIQGGESTITVGTLKSWGVENTTSEVNFIVTETGYETLNLTNLQLGSETVSLNDSLTIDADISGCIVLPGQLTLCDVSGTLSLPGVTLASQNSIYFQDPEIVGKTVVVNLADDPTYGQ
ncbi:MAG: hypothetical protein K6C40_03620, partial [Thermoguttaceae bacterium]|nr:hypothetical protein [Thermoguttaceae bacterium]